MMESIRTHAPFKAEGAPPSYEGNRIRRVFGIALLLEALLVALPLALFQAEPGWALLRFTLSGLGSYLLFAPHTDWLLKLDTGIRLELIIQDDGVGVPEVYRAGVGLRSMRERAEELGGSFILESSPKRGTEIRVRLPLKGMV